MDKWHVLRECANISGLSMREISRRLGKSDNFVNAYINRGGDVGTDNYGEMLKACGYKLCVLPNDDVPKNALIVTNETTERQPDKD